MTPPTSPRDVRATLSRAFSQARDAVRRTGPRLWAGIAIGAVAVVALVVWVNAMVAPVTRAGHPTSTVAPIPAPSTATPSVSPSPSTSGSPTPSSSTSPTAKVPTLKASGKFTTSGVNVGAVSTSGDLRRYSVRVETTAKLNANAVARQLAGILNDPRSWTGSGGVRFALVADPDKADFSITLGAPGTIGKLCKADAAGTCTDSADVLINAALWPVAQGDYAGSASAWQAYLVNHGMGQLLGENPAECQKKGGPAPVMMAQAGDLDGCVANPWPYP
ncbi:MAG TPA: DUF3152 domain-containing protein [Propionicimonas sp.]|uniref:DUF3152 domain-containing protein n=1 Tax=Propionicimonas sp. TaxID=1955623 RepID=UPI002F4160F8